MISSTVIKIPVPDYILEMLFLVFDSSLLVITVFYTTFREIFRITIYSQHYMD